MFEQNEYVVECITNKRFHRGRTQYLVKWLNYSEEDCTWQPKSNLTNVTSLIRQYEERQEKEKKENIMKTRLIRKQRRISSNRKNIQFSSQSQKSIDQKPVQKTYQIKKDLKQGQREEAVTVKQQIAQQSLIEIQIIGHQQNNSQLLPFLQERNQNLNNDFSDVESDIQVLQMRIVNEARFFEVKFASEIKWLSNQIMKKHYSKELIEFYEKHVNIE